MLRDPDVEVLSFDFPLSRSAAQARLSAFLPDAAARYAERRNEDAGPGRHHAVSRLSAALRRRLIGEEEVAATIVEAHGLDAATRFFGELCWRTYWKGWLEHHPAVWHGWKNAVAAYADRPLPNGYALAVEGRTGIDAFDFWVQELRQTGYLHNWARMQFASIWIFTLQLPWELGAEVMFRQLIDADPASNTLSWRWVAGLHTRGKAYLADAERIQRRSGGRFHPVGLAVRADVPRETLPLSPSPPRAALTPTPEAETILLLTPEDLSLETQASVRALPVRRVVACRALCRGASDIAAVADGLQRAMEQWHVPAAWVNTLEDVAAEGDGQHQIVTGYAAVGPTADALATARGQGVVIAEHQRAWDREGWPHCTRGYFPFARHIPSLVAATTNTMLGLVV